MNMTVSGCAITVLVEGLTEFAAASYATDTALLDELRATWLSWPAKAIGKDSRLQPLPRAIGAQREPPPRI
jgi:hypothetical protein